MNAEFREHVATLCEKKQCRSAEFSPEMPCEWEPTSITDPETGLPFSDDGAWRFIARHLRDGHAVQTVVLRKPPGKTGYEMVIDLGDGRAPVYVKVQLGGHGKVFGRSFHRSYR